MAGRGQNPGQIHADPAWVPQLLLQFQPPAQWPLPVAPNLRLTAPPTLPKTGSLRVPGSYKCGRWSSWPPRTSPWGGSHTLCLGPSTGTLFPQETLALPLPTMDFQPPAHHSRWRPAPAWPKVEGPTSLSVQVLGPQSAGQCPGSTQPLGIEQKGLESREMGGHAPLAPGGIWASTGRMDQRWR